MNIELKVGLFGESNVGKTTLIYYLENNKVLYNKITTIGVDYCSKVYKRDNLNIKLQIWDTAGQERYNSIITKYYTVHIPIFIFDVSDESSFNNISNWINNYEKHSRFLPIKKYCIGNKIDLNKIICNDKIEDLCYKNNMIYFENYTNTNKSNIHCIFERIIDDIYKLYKNNYDWPESIKIYEDLNPTKFKNLNNGYLEISNPNQQVNIRQNIRQNIYDKCCS